MFSIAKENAEIATELEKRYGMDQVTWFASSRNTFPFNLSLNFILYFLIALVTMAGLIPYGTPLLSDSHFMICLGTTLTISLLAFHSTHLLIQTTKPLLEKRGIIGKDLNKLGDQADKEPM